MQGFRAKIFQDPISEWLCKPLKIDMDERPSTPWGITKGQALYRCTGLGWAA